VEKADRIILIGQKDSIQTPPNVAWHDWVGYNSPAFPSATASARNGAYMLDALAAGAALARDGRKVIWCRRRWDEHLWPQASAGFFGFWEKAQRRLATQATALAQSRELQQPELLF